MLPPPSCSLSVSLSLSFCSNVNIFNVAAAGGCSSGGGGGGRGDSGSNDASSYGGFQCGDGVQLLSTGFTWNIFSSSHYPSSFGLILPTRRVDEGQPPSSAGGMPETTLSASDLVMI